MPVAHVHHSPLPRLCRTAVVVLAVVLPGAAEAAGIIDRLIGAWQGTTEDSVVRRLEIRGGDGGFIINGKLADDRSWSAEFVPGPQPAVLVAAERQGGIFDWFARHTTGDPLEGEPLSWARLEEDGVVIYRLQTPPSGRFELLRLELHPAEGEVYVRMVDHRHATALSVHEARLRPAEGPQ